MTRPVTSGGSGAGRRQTLRALLADRWAALGLALVALFLVIAVGVWTGAWGQQWAETGAGQWRGPSSEYWLGTTLLGQDIFARAVQSTATAFEIGLLVALASTLLGAAMGALSGWLSGRLADAAILWLKGVIDAIPFYLFVAALAFALQDSAWTMQLAMILGFWTTTARLVRGEIIRLKSLEFVDAGRAMGVSPVIIVLRHLLPNTSHILLVQASIVFVSAIKAEVILSFLGIGTADTISWGRMISESTTEILAGQYMNFIAASGFMFLLVMGVNLFTDGLQDALDPRGRARRLVARVQQP